MDKRSEEIQRWIDTYSLSLLNRAAFLLSHREDAEDIVQDVFIAAFESYDLFRKESDPKTWLMRILKNKVADFYRKKYKSTGHIRMDHFFDETGSWKDHSVLEQWNTEEDHILDNSDFKKTLEDCMEELPPKWMIPMKLYYLEEKKADQVCQETGVSTTNHWKILQRSRMQLRECLDMRWFTANT